MPVAVVDTQLGATFSLITDSLSLRVVSITPVVGSVAILPMSYLGSVAKKEWFPGELEDFEEMTVVYQNSPGLANPSKVVQTITVTGPTALGATVPESVSGSGFCFSVTMLPGYDSASEQLQLKTFKAKFNGVTGPTRTPST